MTVVVVDASREPRVGVQLGAFLPDVIACGSRSELAKALRIGVARRVVAVTQWPMATSEALAIVESVSAGSEAARVLVVLSEAGNDTITSALDTGADDYLVEPCDVAELVARLRPFLGAPRESDSKPAVLSTIASTSAWEKLPDPVTTALSMMVGAEPPPLPVEPSEEDDFAATVALADATNGVEVGVGVLAPPSAAQWVAAQMLGDASTDRALLADLVGELTNVAMGAVKTALVDAGLSLTARIPRRHGRRQLEGFFASFHEGRQLRFGQGGVTLDVFYGLRWRGNRRIRVHDLREDMVLAQDVANPNGMLLVARGTRVTERLADRIRQHLAHHRGITVDVCEI